MSGNRFAGGKHAISQCDVCGQRYKLDELRALVVKNITTNIMACPECWNEDHPQLMLGTFPVDDPQAIRNPRPDLRNDVTVNPVMTGQYTNQGVPIFTTVISPPAGQMTLKGYAPTIR